MSAERPFKLALICGGPSLERGISLNSARSVMDHLRSQNIEIIPLYVDLQKQFHLISPDQLYSNTPADFDFKLKKTAPQLDQTALQEVLHGVDLVFPVIHGSFGEDGELQTLLEEFNVPFVGPSSACCKWMFRKNQAAKTLRENGFSVFSQVVLSENQENSLSIIETFFNAHHLKRAIVKPAVGGSSIGVYSVESAQDAFAKMKEIFSRKLDSHVILEPFCTGTEFTVVIFENLKGEPVALIPTEVELSYSDNQIFDYRKKYLPTNQAAYHTPPRFSKSTVGEIRRQGEEIFKLFGMRDFVRLDGWLMDDGTLYFTDINPVSGLEQNSFLFRQASILGFTHGQALTYILKRACSRYGLIFPEPMIQNDQLSKSSVFVLFGGQNAERQVSLMSGTNVWLKLLQSEKHAPLPFLWDVKGDIWELPYSFTLNHTVEEIYANCQTHQKHGNVWRSLIEAICEKLSIDKPEDHFPKQMTLSGFLERAAKEKAFVFIALHGGEGENGTLQRQLENYQISYNGSNPEVSALCMDKYLTGQAIQNLSDPDLMTLPKKCLSLEHQKVWEQISEELGTHQIIVKPRSDGCSAGIALLQSAEDLERYCHYLQCKVPFIPPFSFANQTGPIEMPLSERADFLFEPFIEMDQIIIENDQLTYLPKKGWIELTVGVFEKEGIYHSLNPSITIAEGSILSLEEKFQGGTGINLTPPPEEVLSSTAIEKIKRLVEKAAKALGIQNYARLDLFFNRLTEKMILIEANSLPGLTPSTVIYHQGLAETPPLSPLALLEGIIFRGSRISNKLQILGTSEFIGADDSKEVTRVGYRQKIKAKLKEQNF